MNRVAPAPHPRGAPSPWIERWSHLLQPGATVLDVACGSGRHLAWFSRRGHAVTGIDRDLAAAQDLAGVATLVGADIENGPWPLLSGGTPRPFGAVVVTNYLWRPLLPVLLQSLADDGVLLYETFASGNETVGRPARPDFLLRPGELLEVCQDLNIVAYENGYLEDPPRFVQRIAAIRSGTGTPSAPKQSRYLL
ncbi:MAG: class I SAM-dependent methyltransferase [Rhodoferax sp.]